MAELALRELALGDCIERELHGVEAVLGRDFTGTTGHGPAAITVTGVTPPVSGSKTCVMPSFLPRIPLAISLLELDLDVDPGRKIEPHQLVDRLRRGAENVDQALVRAHLKVLA